MTNFEKICKSNPQYLADILAEHRSCTWCNNNGNCGGNCSVILCSDYIKEWLNSPAPIELTQTEREICVGLKHLGYEYVARDFDNTLTAHTVAPHKRTYGKWAGNWWIGIDTEGVFSFIKWEDDEPTSIEKLLEG